MQEFSLSDLPQYVGIDIGGTKCAVVLGDCKGNILGRIERATNDGLAEWPSAGTTLLALVDELLSRFHLSVSEVTSVGVSCGGPLSSVTGTILNPPNLAGWRNVPIRDFLASFFPGITVFVENDANATALAELRWGAGKGMRSLAYLTCGTGIGAGLILDGRLYRGKNDFAGEIGHSVIVPNGPLCLCGKKGCLEALASGGAIGRIGAKVFGDPAMTGRRVIELAKGGNAAASSIMNDAAWYLGIGISSLLQTLDLEMVVIGSLAAYAGDSYMETVRETIKENTWQSIVLSTKIVPSGLGKDTQDLAALAIAQPIDNFDGFAEE
jgi:glucokinase